ncbi:H/ACA ribonucleoprotein complex subunit 2-like protein [Mytilus edulis]|uniref:H/ACA ribonucleoprotein complex subunit 2 n=2 Tax=Mytilus TaxID=6548 RepID=A0A8S3V311_MYTED|nr:NHP2 [Mytilus edulis]
MGKSSKEKRRSEVEDEAGDGGDSKEIWQEKIKYQSSISQPLAPRKLTKRIYKAVKKASKQKQLRKGVREVQKFIRKGEKGIVILAGDVSPVDVICHMPLVCEEEGLPYCYTPSKEDLGTACGSKRQTCMVMIKPNDEYRQLYDECYEQVKELPLPI